MPVVLLNLEHKEYKECTKDELPGNLTAGLTLFYNEIANVRISVDETNFTVFIQKAPKIREKNLLGNHGFLRILNEDNEVSFYFSSDGKNWNRVERSLDATGYNHNVFGEFLSLRAGVFAFGQGTATFDNFIYRKL